MIPLSWIPGQDDGAVGTGSRARVTAKAQVWIGLRQALGPVAANGSPADLDRRAIGATPAALRVYAWDNAVPNARLLSHRQVIRSPLGDRMERRPSAAAVRRSFGANVAFGRHTNTGERLDHERHETARNACCRFVVFVRFVLSRSKRLAPEWQDSRQVPHWSRQVSRVSDQDFTCARQVSVAPVSWPGPGLRPRAAWPASRARAPHLLDAGCR